MTALKHPFRSLLLLLIAAGALIAQTAPSKVDPAALRRWQDMRFGMFIHWGPVSLTGREIGWARGDQIPIADYDRLYQRFTAGKFDAESWVRTAKTAGMNYVVLTTKHHDGFCLWDTQQTDFNVMNSPLGRDVVKELAAACKTHGLAFGTYHSTCDWHHPDFPLTSPGGKVKRETHNLDRYTGYLKAQVRELVVNYGPLVTLWFDVPQQFDAKRGQDLIDFVRALQPDIVINDRTGAPGDFDTPEQHIGGFNRERPWETCMTICQQWAWKPDDTMKSLQQCLQTLIYTAGGDGNLLFNVGPMPDGRIEPRQVERLAEMGRWMQTYGDTIYGTRGGPVKPGKWGASTCKGDTVNLFVMNWPQKGPLVIPGASIEVVKARTLTGGTVAVKQTDAGLEVAVPAPDRNAIATIVELTVNGPAFAIEPVGLPVKSGSAAFQKNATASNTFQDQKTYGPGQAFDDDPETRWATDSGLKTAWLEVDLGVETAIGGALIDERTWNRIRQYEIQYKAGDQWKTAHAGERVNSEKTIAFPPVCARLFRLTILDATDSPTLWEFQLFAKP